MTDLKIFRPSDDEVESQPRFEAPEALPREILPFSRNTRIISGRISSKRMRALNRARILFENQKCAYCGKATVEPLELDDAVVSGKNNRVVPGTATIVGFHCHSCSEEWPVYETVRA
ncbi:MAG: hypothetical protein AB8G99_17005 [Planctomycetaceae bacterium]